jgi:26S proteasome regulatory subunit N11
MPQSGTTVTVESVDHVFQTKMLDMLKQTGRYVPLTRHGESWLMIDRRWWLDGITLIQVSDVGYQVSMSILSR